MLSIAPHPHEIQTEVRLSSYADLFGGEPKQRFLSAEFPDSQDETQIDVVVYPLRREDQDFVAMVTNGFSDEGHPKRELLHYCSRSSLAEAHRLRAAAYMAKATGRHLDYADTIQLPYPAGTAWPNAVFLPPLLRTHSNFEITVDGGPMRLLWHLPLTDGELAYLQTHGAAVLLEGISAAKLPWIFEEATRPVLL